MLSTHCRRLRFEPLEDRRLLTTLTVNTLVDENDGIGVGGVSLREAVGAATPGDTVNFSVTGVISLTSAGSGHIPITKDLTIQGPGSSLLTVKAFDPDPGGTNNSNGRRVFVVSDNNAGALANVMISGLTLTNADPFVVNENDGGSAILNSENLTLSACVLSGNYSPNGGSIYSTAGSLSINNCTISGNSAADGGGVLIQGGSLAINRSRIVDNVTTNSGGGIMARGVPVNIVDSTISGNSTDEYGGGVYLYMGSLTASGSTISGNAADNNHDGLGSGGGIFNQGGSLSIVNCTISGNSAGEGGGGVFSNTGQTVQIAHSTITGNGVPNIASIYGGGINSLGVTNLDYTIVAGNVRGAATPDDLKGTFNTTYSLVGDKRDATVNDSGGSLVGTTASPIDAKLAPLANNGGLTLTHALLSGSPALEGGPVSVAGMNGIPSFDQRGTPFSRVVDFDNAGGARIDLGALEMVPGTAMPTLPADYNLNHVVDSGDYVLWRKTVGSSVSPAYSGADGDGNSVVNAEDYTVWRAHFGNTSGEAGGAAVGEGGSLGVEEAAAFPNTLNESRSTSGTQRITIRGTPAIVVDAALGLLMVSDRVGSGDDRGAEFVVSTSGSSTATSEAIDEIGEAIASSWDGV